jgi:DNA-binding protein YbaB
LSNEAARDRVDDVLSGLRDQLVDIAAVRKKQAALKVDAQAADGTVEVTVNAWGQLVKTVIDKSFLDDHDFDELGDYITEAAQAAAREAGQRVAQMMAPINERRSNFPSLSDIVEGIPDPGELMPPGLDGSGPARPPRENSSGAFADGRYDDGEEEGGFPTVRM